jgi:mRNA interferase MazF
VVGRFEIWWTDLDPVRGSEYAKKRPCVVVSPDELNSALATVVVMPMTSVVRSWPFRLSITFLGTPGQVCVDQIRVIDKSRLLSKAGSLDDVQATDLKALIREMYVD